MRRRATEKGHVCCDGENSRPHRGVSIERRARPRNPKVPFDVGSQARLRQPRLPVAVWTVTTVEPEHCFVWQTGVAGVRTVAGHRVEATGSDSTRVPFSLSWRGPLAPLIGLLYGKRSRRYVGMEAQGLKQRCEAC